ncbi:MAG: argininosuccinate lyase [Planctomycetes bacterium]|nr:argininosuccinate lyase [Planctomycetota bacterium]
MAKKLWGGRFQTGMHPLLEAYSESISYDRELACVDIRGSRAHAKMLRKVGLLQAKDLAAINKGLTSIAEAIRKGSFTYDPADEDIHMAIEKALIRRIGEPGRKLHTARSRNDQVATDLRLWCREAIDGLDSKIKSLQQALLKTSQKHKDLIMPGYTHLQRAQPILLPQHLLAYIEMLGRDRERLADARKRVNHLPLGSCALAGTTLKIDREFVQKELGFEGLCENSMDAISDRDFCVEVVSAIALLMAHLSRFSEDVILWASAEWGLVKLADEWSTGSSIMPQKRNPDLLELTRGKTGRVYGDLVALLTLLKGLPMTYNRDLQEDKPQVFDAVRTALAATETLAAFMPTLKFNRKAATALLQDGYLEATALAEYLVEKGLPFRRAHETSGQIVRLAEKQSCRLAELPLAQMQKVSELIKQDIYKSLDSANVVGIYKSAGAAGGKEVRKALEKWQKRLQK